MVFYIIGLGLGSEKDISVRGLEAVKGCSRVYLEAYTSILTVGAEALARFYGKEVVVADREMVESAAEGILDGADKEDVAFLVVGDPFCATTHHDIMQRATARGIKVVKIHNASIMNAVGACGLQLYRFGQAVTIPFFTATWRPDSWYDKIASNKAAGLHTLVLLDIKVKEQSIENLARGRLIYEPPRFMSCKVCAEQLLEVEAARGGGVCGPDALCVGVARLGTDTELIVSATLREMAEEIDMGGPLHSLVLAGDVHEFEQEMMDAIRWKKN
jgi:diphthine synthase